MSGVKAQFVQQMAEINSTITDYEAAKTFMTRMLEGKTERLMHVSMNRLIQ